MPKSNTLTFPLSQTAIIFLGHLNIKMLTTFILLQLDVMYDTSNVPIRPLLDYTVDFSTVEYMQLAKVVPKNSEPLFDHFNRTKI